MAQLRGERAFNEVNLIVVYDPKKTTKDGKGAFLNVQVDQSLKNPDKIKTGEVKADSNPYLASKQQEFETQDGNKVSFVGHDYYYAASQLEKIQKAAGKKTVEFDNGVIVYGIQADLMTTFSHAEKAADGTTKNRKSLIINTKNEMGPTKNPKFTKDILDRQNAVTAAAKEYRASQMKKAPEAEKTEAQIETQVEAVEPEAEV